MLLLLLGGCSFTGEYVPPSVELPSEWRIDYRAASVIANGKWWERFGDDELVRLIDTALKENNNLKSAVARIREYEARARVINSYFYPAIEYGGTMSRRQNSLEIGDPEWRERINPYFAIGPSVRWEIDLWGRIKNMSDAAMEDLLAMEEYRKAVVLKLVSDVVTAYINLLNLDKQLVHARNTYVERKALYELFMAKWEGGQISKLELSQVGASFDKIAAEVPRLEMLIALQENAISILAGRFPQPVKRGRTFDDFRILELPPGIPADIVLQRPDIKAIEHRMKAAHARLNVARLQYLPEISLTGAAGYASRELGSLLAGGAGFWRIGQDITGIIFSGGRIEGDIAAARAVQEELLNEYISALKTAFREVNDALITFSMTREVLSVQQHRIGLLEDYLATAKGRFDAGFSSSYLEVVDAQRSLYEAQVKYSNTKFLYYSSMVDIYKAMGGGWIDSAVSPGPPS